MSPDPNYRGWRCTFTGPYWNEKASGIYKRVCCGAALFSSYASGEGRLAELTIWVKS
jgi:peptide methionine sulfoxide reductase MsrB